MNRGTLRAAALLGAAATLTYFAPAAGAVGDPERDPTADGIGYHVYPSVPSGQVAAQLGPNEETPADIEVTQRSPLRFAIVAYKSSSNPNSRWYNRTRRLFLEDGSLAELEARVRQAGQRIIDLERVNGSGVSWAAVTVQSGFLNWDVVASASPVRQYRTLRARQLTAIDIDRGTAVGLTSDAGLQATPVTEWRVGWDRPTIERRLYEFRDRSPSLGDLERNPSGGFDVLITYDRPNPLIRVSDAAQRSSLRRALHIGTLAGLKQRVAGGTLRVVDLEVRDAGTANASWLAYLVPNG